MNDFFDVWILKKLVVLLLFFLLGEWVFNLCLSFVVCWCMLFIGLFNFVVLFFNVFCNVGVVSRWDIKLCFLIWLLFGVVCVEVLDVVNIDGRFGDSLSLFGFFIEIGFLDLRCSRFNVGSVIVNSFRNISSFIWIVMLEKKFVE